jgi:hypothetical protein
MISLESARRLIDSIDQDPSEIIVVVLVCCGIANQAGNGEGEWIRILAFRFVVFELGLDFVGV